MPLESPQRFGVGGLQNSIVGALLDTAVATWAPDSEVHMCTGTGAVVTITPPWPTFAGVIYFIGDGTWTWTTAGNIAIAGTGKANIAVGMVYNPVTGKWYPIADAVAD